jgi:hypothetical protein
VASFGDLKKKFPKKWKKRLTHRDRLATIEKCPKGERNESDVGGTPNLENIIV